MREGGVELRRGEDFFLTNQEIMGDEKGAFVNYASLPDEVKPGDTILLSDGTIALVPDWKDTDEMLERSKRIPQELGMASKGEKIVIIAGVPISMPGTTNLIKVEIVE